ncbi:MAG: adenine glycosylase [Micrococcales bacterium 73-13]|nr:MAG: adenine glycosylase [Micrococcales bacterium 73-13]
MSEGAAPPDVAAAASAWYREHGRDFLWRRPGMTPWAIYLIEVMAQQTQIERAARVALEWIERWPSPSALAATPPSEILKAWDRLGYPRRALALHRAATAMAAEHGDEVPRDLTALLALPGVGPYTAAAVASFAYGQRVPVVDTNIRRVLARAIVGVESLAPSARRDAELMDSILPEDAEAAKVTNVAVMELGALVCTPRAPRCEACPIADACAWRAAGYPLADAPRRTRQPRFAGSDREARGLVMAELRSADRPVGLDELAVVVTDPERLARALSGLLHDGLAVAADGGYALP